MHRLSCSTESGICSFTRNWTHFSLHCKMDSYPLDQQGSPITACLLCYCPEKSQQPLLFLHFNLTKSKIVVWVKDSSLWHLYNDCPVFSEWMRCCFLSFARVWQPFSPGAYNSIWNQNDSLPKNKLHSYKWKYVKSHSPKSVLPMQAFIPIRQILVFMGIY